MKDTTANDPSLSDNENTGLPWPKTWKGAYLFVIASFLVWLLLLLALTELFV
jgi:hypothetical protein